MAKGPDPKEVEALKRLLQTNLKILCTEVLGMNKWEDPLHGELASFLNQPGDQKLILMPRGHLKTSLVTVAWATQQVLKDFNIRILIANAVWDNARAILGQISDYLTYKSLLPAIYGDFKNTRTRWTRDEVEIAQRTIATAKEATFETAGIETAKTGRHYDLIIADDLVERNNVGTREQMQKVITFYRDLLDLLDPGGRLVVIGTRWALGDLYGHLIETEMRSLNGHVFKDAEDRANWRKYAPSQELVEAA